MLRSSGCPPKLFGNRGHQRRMGMPELAPGPGGYNSLNRYAMYCLGHCLYILSCFWRTPESSPAGRLCREPGGGHAEPRGPWPSGTPHTEPPRPHPTTMQRQQVPTAITGEGTTQGKNHGCQGDRHMPRTLRHLINGSYMQEFSTKVEQCLG